MPHSPFPTNRTVHLQKLHIEDQLGVGGNLGRRSGLAVARLGVDDQLSSSALLHGYVSTPAGGPTHNAVIPALDHLTHADLEGESLLARLVEHVLVGEGAHVLHRALAALARGLAVADGDVLVGNELADLLDLRRRLLLLRALLVRSLGGALTLLYCLRGMGWTYRRP